MFFLLFIRLPRLRRRVCVFLFRHSTVISRQSLVVVWKVIPRRVTNRPARLPTIWNIGCAMSQFELGALEFLVAEQNGCTATQRLQC